MSDHKGDVIIDKAVVWSIEQVYRTNPKASSTINAFHNLLTREEFVINGVTEKKVYSFASGFSKERIELDLIPALNAIVHNLILFGIAVVRVAVSQNFPDESTLVVVPLRDCNIKISFNKEYQRTYRAYPVGGSNNKEIPTSYVAVVDEPDETGRLMSPIALCLRHLEFGGALWKYYVDSTNRRVNPAYVFGQDDTGGKLLSTAGMEASGSSIEMLAADGSGLLGADQVHGNAVARQAQAFQRNTGAVLDQIEQAREQARERPLSQEDIYGGTEQINQLRRDIGGTSREIARIEAKPPISTHPFFLPTGMRLERTPEVLPPTEFVTIQESISNDIFRALGFLPPGTSGDSKFANNIDYINSNLSTVLRMFARKTEPVLSRCANMMLDKELEYIVFNDVVVNEFDEDVRRVRADYATKEALQYSRDPVPEQGWTDVPVPVEDEERLSKIPFKKPKMSVRVQYGHNPIIDPEMALVLRDTHVITQEAYQTIMLQSMNLPDSMREKKSLAEFMTEEAKIAAIAKPLPKKPASSSKKPKAKKARTK